MHPSSNDHSVNREQFTLPHDATGCAVVDEARRLFEQSPYLPVRDLTCEFHEGALIIRGRVPTYYLKQVAQTIAQKVAGVEEILNRVEVANLSVWQPPPASVWNRVGRGRRRG